jgi:N4-gp56 family major capsid protein
MAYSGVDTGGSVTALPEALLDVMSAEVLHEALGVMQYEQFAVRKNELLASPGETVLITKYNQLARGGKLVESTPMTSDNLSASQISITVDEFGKAIGLTEKLVRLSWDDLTAEVGFQLGRDYALVRDLDIRDVLVAGGNVILTNPAGSVLVDVGAAHKFDVETIRVAVEALKTANAPKFNNDFYVCFAHPHQIAYLKRDPDWMNAHNYHQTRAPFNGEAGRWEDVVFIETTHQGNGAAGASDAGYDGTLDGTGATGIDLYRATTLADQSYAIADAMMVEVRDNGVEDFGRLHALAWLAIWGVGILEDDFIQHIISS